MNHDAKSPPEASHKLVSPLVVLVIVLIALVIPAKIIHEGFLPEDDALRNAAQAVSGKPWSEVMIIGSGNYTVDHNFGWNWVLRRVYAVTHWDTERILKFSMTALFVILGICALPWLKRPEAWLGALLICTVGWAALPMRAMMGRPLLVSTFALLTILFLWHKRNGLRPDWRTIGGLAVLIGAAIWLHGTWYLWGLLIVAFVLAREFQWAGALVRAWIIGAIVAALLTGHPLTYLSEALLIAVRTSAMHPTPRTMVSEYHPISGGLLIFLVPGAMLILRRLAKLEARPLTANPLFWMAVLGWLLGFVARRFWEDWGLWALAALAACDLNLLLVTRVAQDSFKRLALAGGLALAVFLVFTSDLDSRWSRSLSRQYLVESDPDLAGWLPERGGIFYAPDPGFFYETYFRNPNAPWRYMLGFEITLMPEEDFETVYRIIWNNGAAAAFEPWVKKMHPEDRLFVRGDAGSRPPIPGLEWHYTLGGMWSGRVPRR